MTESKTRALYMIGNAHLDPVWLWTWQEGFQEAKATFRSALDRLCEDDDFLFTSNSAALYEWIERNDPQMFREIQERVREGRWEICGGWWIQPDCNIPGGESFVRQGLYGQRFFSEKLGVTSTVGYNVDSFGHAGSLPQILARSGMPNYVFMRPHPHEQHLPSRLFWWESGDGSRVLTFRIPYEYTTWGKDLRKHVERCAAEFVEGGPDGLMCFYGVGNHGGGPTRENIDSIHALRDDPTLPDILFSTPSRYFAAMRESGYQPPVFHDELQMHAVGCYAAHSGVKRWNRLAENQLLAAEKLSVLASRVSGQRYPDDFALAWKDVLFNQFHDILAGTSIEPAYDDARNLYGEALAIAGRNLNNAVQSISWKVNLPLTDDGFSKAFVVFNPHSWPVRQVVEHEMGRMNEGDALEDDRGEPVPLQRVRSYATVQRNSRNRLAFEADVPAFGYRTYRLVRREEQERFPAIDAGDTWLDNGLYRLEFDPDTGYLAGLYDIAQEYQYLRGPGAKPVVLDDRSDTWSHRVVLYDQIEGAFTARSVKLVEHGPVKSVVRVQSGYGASVLQQDFTMYPGRRQMDVHVTVDWREHFTMLKLEFPLFIDFPSVTFETPYGHLQRAANGHEVPGQGWFDMSGIGRGNGNLLGLSILNDGKYSFDATTHALRLTVLRSPIYAHHEPYMPVPDEEYSFIDQGIQRFTYSLVPHMGGWQEAEIVRRTAELNQPLIVQVESPHAGPLPLSDSFLSVDSDHVDVTAIKQWEDGDALILRCFETAGRSARARIALPHWGQEFEADFGPGELRTYLVPCDSSEPPREVNLIEWEESSIP